MVYTEVNGVPHGYRPYSPRIQAGASEQPHSNTARQHFKASGPWIFFITGRSMVQELWSKSFRVLLGCVEVGLLSALVENKHGTKLHRSWIWATCLPPSIQAPKMKEPGNSWPSATQTLVWNPRKKTRVQVTNRLLQHELRAFFNEAGRWQQICGQPSVLTFLNTSALRSMHQLRQLVQWHNNIIQLQEVHCSQESIAKVGESIQLLVAKNFYKQLRYKIRPEVK